MTTIPTFDYHVVGSAGGLLLPRWTVCPFLPAVVDVTGYVPVVIDSWLPP